MLTESFIDWWFAPWRLQTTTTTCEDLLAQRDGYRLWCEQHAIAADLPSQFDAGWVSVACSDATELCATARLYAGLLAARTHNRTLLASLSQAERKWCVSVAVTQPLEFTIQPELHTKQSLEILGLSELARYLQQGFPGIWSRLRLLLTPVLVSQIPSSLLVANNTPQLASSRMRRCWLICLQRVKNPAI